MRGVISSKDVVVNLGLIWREFGPGCVYRCLRAIVSREPTTFLDVAMKQPRDERLVS
jgi:hypothetical protein